VLAAFCTIERVKVPASPRARWSLALSSFFAALLVALALFELEAVPQWDHAISRWFAANRSGALTEAMLFMSRWHSTLPVLVAAAAIGAWLVVRRERLWLLRLVAAVPGGMVLNVGLKNIFQRARPVMEEPLVHLTTYSFPSGHAVASTVFWGWVAAYVVTHVEVAWVRSVVPFACAAMAITVMFSRVYLGAHFPADVIAGGFVGTAWLAAVFAVSASRR